MAEFDYDGDGSTWVTPKANTNGSGTATFWDNSFKKVVDRTKYLYEKRNRVVGDCLSLAEYNGVSQETLTGSGSLPGTLIDSALLQLDMPINGAIGDVITVDCVFRLKLNILGTNTSPAKCKLVVVHDDTGDEFDVPGSNMNFASIGAGTGSAVETRVVIGGRYTLTEEGPVKVFFRIRLANTESANVMGDGFLRASMLRIGT